MVKPQFEVGRGRLGSGGVVREPELRLAALRQVASCAGVLGWTVRGAVASPAPGPAGNVEYFLWLRRSSGAAEADRFALLERAVREGPQ
jgi:23S rRNA (cytidine1920-2'-O)/16S rRNA (cytidine1409-2'-O)-methyltransferase